MTTIASTSATTSYRYTKLASGTTESQSISSNATGSSTGVSSTSSEESALIDSAQKLLSQLMSMLMSMQQGQTASDGSQSDTGTGQQPGDLATSMDTDGDGKVSLAEFVGARPSDVSEEQATNLFNSFDTESSGSLTVDQLNEAMAGNAQPMGAGPPPPPSSSDDSLSDLFSSLDTDGDGVISQEEFASGRPDDVSEEQANALFLSLDQNGAGSITEDQFLDALRRQPPSSSPDFQYPAFESDDESTQTFIV